MWGSVKILATKNTDVGRFKLEFDSDRDENNISVRAVNTPL